MSDSTSAERSHLILDRFKRSPVLLRTKSFEEFHKAVLSETTIALDDEIFDEDLCEAFVVVRHGSQSIFLNDSINNKTKESKLQQVAFGYLSVFGELALENTSDSIKDFFNVDDSVFKSDLNAESFRNICFTGRKESSKRVDCTVRVRGEFEEEIVSVEKTLKSSPRSRLCPWAAVSYIEFKKLNEQLGKKHILQCCEYAANVLMVSPDRQVVFCCLTNFYEIVYVAACVSIIDGQEKFAIYCTRSLNKRVDKLKLSSETWITELGSFLSTKPHLMGYNGYIYDNYSTKMISGLGRGAYSAVVEIEPIDGCNVMKVSRHTDGIANEVRVVTDIRNKLKGSVWLECIPKCKAGPKPFIAYHKTKFTVAKSLSIDEFCQLYQLVKAIHSTGYAHRDIRLANIVRVPCIDGKKRIGLIDFSSAHKENGVAYGDVTVPAGALSTASYNVVEAFYAKNPSPDGPLCGDYACSLEDEMISIVFLAIQTHKYFIEDYEKWCPDDRATQQDEINESVNEIESYLVTNKSALRDSLASLHTHGDLTDKDRDELFSDCMNALRDFNTAYTTEIQLKIEQQKQQLLQQGPAKKTKLNRQKQSRSDQQR